MEHRALGLQLRVGRARQDRRGGEQAGCLDTRKEEICVSRENPRTEVLLDHVECLFYVEELFVIAKGHFAFSLQGQSSNPAPCGGWQHGAVIKAALLKQKPRRGQTPFSSASGPDPAGMFESRAELSAGPLQTFTCGMPLRCVLGL